MEPIEILTIIFVVGISILAIALYYLLRYFPMQPMAYRWLAYVVMLSLFCDLISVVVRAAGLSSNIGGIIYNAGFLAGYSAMFYQLIRGRLLKILLSIVNGLYFLWVVSNALFIQKLGINSYSMIVGSLVLLILCIHYYFHLLRSLPVQQVYRLPFFWIISSIFFVTSGKLVIYTVIYYLTTNYDDNLIFLWMGHNSLSVIQNILIAYGAWLQYKNLKAGQHDVPKVSA